MAMLDRHSGVSRSVVPKAILLQRGTSSTTFCDPNPGQGLKIVEKNANYTGTALRR